MTDKPENPRAFPLSVNDVGDCGCEGMTLRDYFAAKAMQGVLMANSNVGTFSKIDADCYDAYRYADAMLKARQNE